MSIGIAYNPCKNCKEMDKCSICELTYYRKGYIKSPTADAVEVVRCKDCKYCVDLIMGGLWCEHPDNRNPLGCRPNDYCNDGERREDSE